jgi:diguanylate cyclase
MHFPMVHSLRGRILALVLGLVTLVLTAAIVGIAVKAHAEVETQIGAELRSAAATAREILRFRGSQLTTSVEALSSDFGFKDAVSQRDAATVRSAIESQRAKIEADLIIVLTPDGAPVASTGDSVSSATQLDLKRLIQADPDGEVVQLYRMIDGRPYQLVLAPVLAPQPIGWTAMGFALDERLAAQMSKLLGVDVLFVSDGTKVGSADFRGGPEATPFLRSAGKDKLLTWINPIRSANGPLAIVLQRSLASALRPYEDIKRSMVALGALLLAIATLLAAWVARSATRPVLELTRIAGRLESGDYSVAVPAAATTELKGLARAFNAMRGAVADREATIRHQAHHHSLTGLPTRSLISEVLDELLLDARSPQRQISVCLIEVQDFQRITGSFGHPAGDEVLREVARRLRAHSSRSTPDATTRVGHLGTDQFLFIMHDTDRVRAAAAASAILDSLRSSFEYESVTFQVELRAGVATFPADGAAAAQLLQRADLALYRAKETGATIGVYAQGEEDSHRQRLSILGDLRNAIEQGQLELHYQPKVHAASERVAGCEALLRWRHPQHGYVPPGEFIPHAERTGAIRSLTAWVLETAFKDQARWEAMELALDVSINVSPTDFSDSAFADRVTALLVKTGANASRVILEVTESGAMKDLTSTLSMMEQLRVLGVRFSIDDFGTGHSSLAHLKRLLVDEVKIDRSFIKELDEHHDDVIVRSTIGLGHALSLKVVAEGVENQAQWAMLARLGCDLIQGYYVSKPVPAADFLAWVAAWKAERVESKTNTESQAVPATPRMMTTTR